MPTDVPIDTAAAFRTDDPNMLDEWLTVGPAWRAESATADAPVVTTLLGAEVRLWRDDGGDDGGGDGSGRLMAQAGGRALAVQQRYGYAWVCPSGRPRAPLFAFPAFDEPGRRIVDCDGLGVATSPLRMVENFLDMGHFPYVHPGVLGQVPQTEVPPYTVEADPATGELWARDCRFHQPRASGTATAPIEARYQYRVMQPTSTMLFKTSIPRPDALDAIALFVQPVNEESCVAYCLLVLFDDDSSEASLIAFQQGILGQDKPIVENQRPRRLPLLGRLETPARCDALSMAYRRWLAGRGMRYGVFAG